MSRTLTVPLRAASALAVATTEYGVYDAAKKTSTATSTTSNKLTDTAGLFTTTAAIAVGDILKNTTTGTFALVTAVDSATALSISADIMTSGNAYSIYPGLGYKLQDKYTEMVVILDVTAAATEVGDLLDVYIDTSFDGGVSFINLGRFTQVLGNGGAKKFLMSFKANPLATSNLAVFSTDQTAGNALQIGFGDRLRYRAAVTDAATLANVSFNFSLKAQLK